MPKLKELSDRYQDQGLVLIGVHTKKGGETMEAYVEKTGIQYPVAVDGGETVTSFAVDSYPDYYLIDRAGNLRVADLANGDLERAIGVLLREEAPNAIDPALAEASATAIKKDKRMLVLWGSESEQARVRALTKGDRELAKLLRNEFEVVGLDRSAHPELADSMSTGLQGPMLTALYADGGHLATRSADELDADGLRRFIEEFRIPAKDAEKLWADALSRAERENKRVLVHLGAPW